MLKKVNLKKVCFNSWKKNLNIGKCTHMRVVVCVCVCLIKKRVLWTQQMVSWFHDFMIFFHWWALPISDGNSRLLFCLSPFSMRKKIFQTKKRKIMLYAATINSFPRRYNRSIVYCFNGNDTISNSLIKCVFQHNRHLLART